MEPIALAGSALIQAIEISPGVLPITFTDAVSSFAPNDYYAFQLTNHSNLNVTLTDLSADADVAIIHDENDNGMVDNSEVIAVSRNVGTDSESVSLSGLVAGNYFIHVRQYLGTTNYTLGVSTGRQKNLIPSDLYLEPLDDVATIQRNSVDNQNASNIYSFSVFGKTNLNLALTDLSNDADVQIIEDKNNNGLIDTGEIIATSHLGSTTSESINLANLKTGKYFVQVYQYLGDTYYNLKLSTKIVSNLIAAEKALGNLNGSGVKLSDFIGEEDTSDIYSFSLDQTSSLSLELNQLSQDADVRIIQDHNDDGLIERDEVIAVSRNENSQEEFIELSELEAGNYFVQVYQYSGQTSYDLALKTIKKLNFNVNIWLHNPTMSL